MRRLSRMMAFVALIGLPAQAADLPRSTGTARSEGAEARAPRNPLLARLKAAGFTCTAKAAGQFCTARANGASGFSYPQPIAVSVPAGVTQPKQILLYLHGFRGICPANGATLEQIDADWQLTQQMITGGVADSVLLFPASQGNCATYDSSLVPRFKQFVEWALALLQPSTPQWIVAGHSGAGARMANALSAHPAIVKNTRAVFLLDATYGMSSTSSPYLDKWAEVVRQNGNIKIFSRYLAGTSTDPGSRNLKRRLPQHVDSAVSAGGSHCRVPAVEIRNLLQKRFKKESDLELVSF